MSSGPSIQCVNTPEGRGAAREGGEALQEKRRELGWAEAALRAIERRRENLLEREALEATRHSKPWMADQSATTLREVGHDLQSVVARIPGGIPGAGEAGSPGELLMAALGVWKGMGRRCTCSTSWTARHSRSMPARGGATRVGARRVFSSRPEQSRGGHLSACAMVNF